MRWRALVVAATAGLVVLVTAGPAMAKGADQATVSGPGLTRPVVVAADGAGGGEPGSGERLAILSEDSGLFLAMFGPDSGSGTQRLSSDRPAGELGPKYQLVYRVPDGNPTPATVTQDLYPLAAGGPVTYTRPDQPVMGGTTRGGWYRGSAEFAALLVALGVPGMTSPALAPTATPVADRAVAATGSATGDSTGAGHWIAVAAVAFAACVVAALLIYRTRVGRARLSR
jgi:hypothetical protein